MVWPTETDRRLEESGACDLLWQQLQSSHAISRIDHILRLDINAPPACQRLTGIIATIGKSSREVEFIEKMIAAGMNIALINFGFGTVDEHVETIKNIREASKNYSQVIGQNCPVAIAASLWGRKIRTGKILYSIGDKVEIIAGEIMRLTTDETYMDRCTGSTVYIDYMNLAEQLIKGAKLYLDNEEIMITVEMISKTTITCKVNRGGFLGSYKDVFIPNLIFDVANFTNKDKESIELAVRFNLDIIIAPFVHSTNVITELRHLLGEKGKKIAIVANLQSIHGFRNLDAILQISNGIMITRQELGSEITPKKLVIAQKNIITRANQANVPVLISAHILSSMEKRRVPLRSELLDIANCVLDGADALVLSAETAIGLCPIETIKVMADVCKEAEACVWTRQIFIDLLDKTPIPCDETTGVALAAVLAAHRSLAAAIIVLTTSGKSAEVVSKFKPKCPIIAVTRYASVAKRMHMWRAVIPLIYEDTPNKDWEREMSCQMKFCTSWAIERGFMRADDPYVLVSGWQGFGVANTMRIVYATSDM